MSLRGFDPEANSLSPQNAPEPRRRRGLPSNGCNQCRVRKVKCDEALPSCQRCRKSGSNCVYRDRFEAMLRDQTQEAAAKAQKRWRSRAALSTAAPPSDIIHAGQQPQPRISPRPSRTLMPPIRELARQRFIYDFVVPIDESPDQRGVTANGSYFAFVPSLCNRASEDSGVMVALSTAANANFGNRCKSSQAHTDAFSEYDRTLRIMNRALQSPDHRISLDDLAAALLLGIHDLISPPDMTHGGSWRAHANGAAALLIQKYQGDPHMHEVAGLLQIVWTQMLLSNLTTGTRPIISLDVCMRRIPADSASASLLGHLYETAALCADWYDAKATYLVDQEQFKVSVADIISRGQALDDAVMNWMNDALGQETFETLENCTNNVPAWLRPLFSLPGATTKLHRYQNIHVSHRWQFCRGSRLVLLSTVVSAIDCLLSLLQDGSARDAYNVARRRCQVRLLDLVEGLCQGTFSVFTLPITGKPEPRSFADVVGVRAYQLIWPMGRAGVCLGLGNLRGFDVSKRSAWIRSTLCCIRDELGLRQTQGYLDYMDSLIPINGGGVPTVNI
ncbi:hypothetical protein GQ53DRAFT_843799 [Thozetella sp. PMI_491]|nr:hypothetical protein GQ53DRAFT_843799 [Thozetella sp. PMI_491]